MTVEVTFKLPNIDNQSVQEFDNVNDIDTNEGFLVVDFGPEELWFPFVGIEKVRLIK